MERIVFNQNELDMLGSEVKSVGLCDNDYIISPTPDTAYIAIGDVNAVVKCPAIKAISMGMTFIGFTPEFDGEFEEAAPAAVSKAPITSSSFNGSFTSSFKSSFTTSYSTSFTGMYEYEYHIGSSFRSGSFSGSFKSGSFRMNTSFKIGSMGVMIKKRPVVREIAVNGYGLNLI